MEQIRQQNFFKLTAAGCFLAAAALRFSLFYRSLQYDELWSLQFFSVLDTDKILFDLSLPNNHPLNTLAIKLASAASDDIFCIRIFSLICGILLPIPAGFAIAAWCKDKYAGFLTAALTAFSAPLVIYSALARGYIIQAFFFALTAAGFACFSEKTVKKCSLLGFILITAGGAGTILSVPTGIVFLAALLVALFARYRTIKVHKFIIAAIITGIIFSAVYYAKIYSSLTEATKWSVGGNYFSGCGKILLHTAFGTIIAVFAAIKLAPNKTLPLLIIPFTVLLSGAVTGLGPDRTYIIFSMVFTAVCAIASTELFKRSKICKVCAILLMAIFAAGQIYLTPQYLLPDWKMADTQTDNNTLTVYPANSGYPLLWNKERDFLANYHAATTKFNLKTIKVYAENGVFNGMDTSFGEKQIKTELKGTPGNDKVLGKYHLYNLELCSETPSGKGYYLVVYPLNKFQAAPPQDALRLNPHFENSLDNSGMRCGVYFTSKYPADPTAGNIFLIKGI